MPFTVGQFFDVFAAYKRPAVALLYPAAAMASGHAYPRVPTFGVPCPTTIFTVGILIGAGPALPRYLALVPILWAGIGGSAAFLLGVRADFLLLVAGAVMAVDVMQSGLAGKRRHAGDGGRQRPMSR